MKKGAWEEYQEIQKTEDPEVKRAKEENALRRRKRRSFLRGMLFSILEIFLFTMLKSLEKSLGVTPPIYMLASVEMESIAAFLLIANILICSVFLTVYSKGGKKLFRRGNEPADIKYTNNIAAYIIPIAGAIYFAVRLGSVLCAYFGII